MKIKKELNYLNNVRALFPNLKLLTLLSMLKSLTPYYQSLFNLFCHVFAKSEVVSTRETWQFVKNREKSKIGMNMIVKYAILL